MKRLSDMTIRQRGRLLSVVQAIPVLFIFIIGLALGNWVFVVVAVGLLALLVLLLWSTEKRTRDDPPHAGS